MYIVKSQMPSQGLQRLNRVIYLLVWAFQSAEELWKMAYVVPYYLRSYDNGISGALLPGVCGALLPGICGALLPGTKPNYILALFTFLKMWDSGSFWIIFIIWSVSFRPLEYPRFKVSPFPFSVALFWLSIIASRYINSPRCSTDFNHLHQTLSACQQWLQKAQLLHHFHFAQCRMNSFCGNWNSGLTLGRRS